MRYDITHTTTYTYQQPVSTCHNHVRLTPRDTAAQRVIRQWVQIEPMPEIADQYVDYFGNTVKVYTVQKSHTKLVVTARSMVEVFTPMTEQAQPLFEQAAHVDGDSGGASSNPPAPAAGLTGAGQPGSLASAPWETVRDEVRQYRQPETLDAYQYVFDSLFIEAGPMLRAFAEPSFKPGRPLLEAAFDLNQRIHEEFEYDPAATTTATPIAEVLRDRKGVCQDFAHLMIGCLRSLGLPARYISGYIRTYPPEGKPRLVGADASHAWVSVFSPRRRGWVDFDPTNKSMPGIDHITVAWGRDYDDVSPVKGVTLGGGDHNVAVGVDVAPVEDASQAA